MNDDEARALGVRWTMRGGGCLGGMRDLATGLVYRFDDDCLDDAVPDFRAGCTKGAALEFVREKLGDPEAHLRLALNHREPVWTLWTSAKWRLPGTKIEEATEGAALVAALEAAP